jgi:hypothetical protein
METQRHGEKQRQVEGFDLGVRYGSGLSWFSSVSSVTKLSGRFDIASTPP